MARIEKVPTADPDIQITLSWDEAKELYEALGKSAQSYEVFSALEDLFVRGL